MSQTEPPTKTVEEQVAPEAHVDKAQESMNVAEEGLKPTALELISGLHFDATRIVQNAFDEKLAEALDTITASNLSWLTVRCPFNEAIATRCTRNVHSKHPEVTIVQAYVTKNQFEFVVRRFTEAEKLAMTLSKCATRHSVFSHENKTFGSGGTAELTDFDIEKWITLQQKATDSETNQSAVDCLKETLARYLIAQRYHYSLVAKWNALNRPDFYGALPQLGESVQKWLSDAEGPATVISAEDESNCAFYGKLLSNMPAEREDRIYLYKSSQANGDDLVPCTWGEAEAAGGARCVSVVDVVFKNTLI